MVFFLINSGAVIAVAGDTYSGNSLARTGSTGNQPTDGFYEGNTIIRLHNATGVTTTHFQQGEDIYVNITTSIFGTHPDKGKIKLTDYGGNNIDESPGQGAFKTVSQVGQTRVISGVLKTSSKVIPDDHYLLEAIIEQSGMGGKIIKFYDVIKIGTGGTNQKSIELSADKTFTTQKYSYGSSDKFYLKIYAPDTIAKDQSWVKFVNYFDQIALLSLGSLTNSTISKTGNYAIFELDLDSDFGFNTLPSGFESGNWFTIQMDLKNSNGDSLGRDWSVQLFVAPAPFITKMYANPATVEVTGTDSTNISVEFSDIDAKGPDEFLITIEVRDPAGRIFTLVKDQKNGFTNLVVKRLSNGNYSANFTWDPETYMISGDYSLSATITDGNDSTGMTDFDDNKNKLKLTSTADTPSIESGTTWCDPVKVDKAEQDTTTIYAEFTDPDDTDRDAVVVTFKIRSQSATEIVLVDGKGHGGAGEFGGNLMVQKTGDLYTASYKWDPPVSVENGFYDLYFSVNNTNGGTVDSYANNSDELEILDLGLPPELIIDSIQASPTSVDKIGVNTTTFFAEFTDTDKHDIKDFDITLMIKNDNNDELVLLNATSNGEPGKLGGTMELENTTGTSPLKYTMSYKWDPDEFTPTGTYDIYVKVVDVNGKWDISDYDDNQEELTVISSVLPPVITADVLTAVPSSVNKIGSGDTRISAEFKDTAYKNITDFKVTFKVKDPDDNVITLVDSQPSGTEGKDGGIVNIEISGTVFFAEYFWDPPGNATIGKYDLYFGVMNKGGGFAEDTFDTNSDELEIVTTATPPSITDSDTICIPDRVNINNTNTTVISAVFTDADNNPVNIFKVSFKIKHQDGTEIILVEDLKAGENAPFGGTINITRDAMNETYNASYEWDPANGTEPGFYDLFFSVEDETLALVEDGYTNNVAELELYVSSDKPHTEPEIAKLTDGKAEPGHDHDINFTITYTNSENNPPNENGVIVVVDGKEYTMMELNESDMDYTDGKQYYLVLNDTGEDFEYGFKVNDTAGNRAEIPDKPFAPEDDHHEDEHGEKHDTSAQVYLALILIILVLILILLFSRRKKGTGEEIAPEGAIAEPEEPAPEAEAAPADETAEVPEAMPVEGDADGEVPEAAPVEEPPMAEAAPAAPAEPVDKEG